MSFWIIPQIIMILLGIPFALISLYLLVLAVASLLHPERKLIDGIFQGKRTPQNRFIILVPAYNEELLIGEVITSLHQQFYPEDHYEIVVIADNCTDATAAIATAAGATALVRHDLIHRGKGQALNWAIQGPLLGWTRPWDALVIVDADSILSSDFLWFMNERLQQGYQAIQGYYGVLNPSENWRTSLMSAALSVFHFLRPLGRDKLGLPCGLKGNGMCFSRVLVERFGYPATSVVEDMELALIYLQHGIGVKFSAGAQVYAQMAATQRHADTQRSRWEGGRLELLKQWAVPLWLQGIRERNLKKFDGAMDLFVPPLTLLFLPALLGWLIMFLNLLFHPLFVEKISFTLWSFSLAAICVYMAVGLILTRAPLAVWLQLAALPLFLFWKIVGYLRMMFVTSVKARTEWVRTGRQKM